MSKYDSTIAAPTITPDVKPDAYTRTYENAHAALGTFFGGVGVVVLMLTTMAAVRLYAVNMAVVVLVGGVGYSFGLSLMFYGFLAAWRNTIDERRDSAELAAIEDENETMRGQNRRLLDVVKQKDERIAELERMRTVTINDRAGTRTAPATSQIAQMVSQWLRANLFDAGGRLTNVTSEKKRITVPYPYKTAQRSDPDKKAAHDLLLLHGWIVENSGYEWHGPDTWLEVVEVIG